MNKKIIGYDAEKNEMEKLKNMILNASKYRKMGVRLPKGVILWGSPGVGKTILARSVASNSLKLFELKAADCCNDDAVTKVKEIFSEAKKNTPCIILLDEIDKIAGDGFKSSAVNGYVNKTLLQELDDISSDMDILVIGTCNDKFSLGESLTRSGRFDRIIRVPNPDYSTRRDIMKEYFSQIKIEQNLDFDYLAKITSGFSGATLECIANESAIRAIEKDENIITISEVREVIDKMKFGTEAKASKEKDESLKHTAIHEAGHCLAALMLCPDNVEEISIMSRGDTKGFLSLCILDFKSISVEEYENGIAVALAGHVAERVILGQYYLGSSSDLQRASEMARRIIISECAYGYGYAMAEDSGSPFKKTPSDKALDLQEKILDRLDKKVADLISKNRELFDRLVEALLDKQTLSRDEILELKKEYDERNAA